MAVRLHLPSDVHRALWQHLLPRTHGAEDVAFLFASASEEGAVHTFEYIDWSPVPPQGFASRSAYHLELSDKTRAAVIKRAHDLGASLVEFHSHRGKWPAHFSLSDWDGFEEFVPHVLWRLKGRPYAAVVVTATGFDALVWLKTADAPTRLDALLAGGQVLSPTRLSPLTRDGYENHDKRTL